MTRAFFSLKLPGITHCCPGSGLGIKRQYSVVVDRELIIEPARKENPQSDRSRIGVIPRCGDPINRPFLADGFAVSATLNLSIAKSSKIIPQTYLRLHPQLS
jgi:hypothetical protein